MVMKKLLMELAWLSIYATIYRWFHPGSYIMIRDDDDDYPSDNYGRIVMMDEIKHEGQVKYI